MHYFKFRGLAYSILIASLVFILSSIAAVSTLAFGIGHWLLGEEFYIYGLAISAGVFLLLKIVLASLSGKCRCQLCKTSLFKLLGCTKSSEVTPLLGSYRLKTSLSAVCTGKFRCIYCGEAFDIWAKPLPPEETYSASGSRTRRAGKTLPGRK